MSFYENSTCCRVIGSKACKRWNSYATFSSVFSSMCTQKGKTATNAIFEVLAPSLQKCVHQFDHTKGWLGQKAQEPATKIVGNLHACVLDLSLTHVHEAGKSLL